MHRPVVGITADLIEHNGLDRAAAPVTYCRAVTEAGGVPLVLPPLAEAASEQIAVCHALVLTGGDDPALEPFGVETDSRVTRVRPGRQAADSAILEHLANHQPDLPVLGVCLGMQMMALHAGGTLDQFMPDTTPTHADHWERDHAVHAADSDWIPGGSVQSKHKQAVTDPGHMRTAAVAHDGIIEAIVDPDRCFYLGVQWHPERTAHEPLGIELFRRLVRSAR